MANRYIGPGNSVPWFNDTGRDAASESIVPFGGGIAAITRIPTPAGVMGQVSLTGVWELDAPEGLNIARGDVVYAADGKLAASGDVLGIAVSPVLRGRVRVKLMPVRSGGGSGGAATTLREGEGIAITAGRNPQGGLEYAVSLDLALKSENDKKTKKKENTP